MPIRPSIRVLCLLSVVICAALTGCADKPGTTISVEEATPVRVVDPSMSHSVAVIGQETTSTHGPLITETSKLNDEGMWETNSGGAAKQRLSIVVLPDGTIRAGGSAASDLDIGEITSTWTPVENGMSRSLSFKNVRTNNTSVQRAVNEAVATLVIQWQRASDNERAVLEAQLAAQAKLGDSAAQVFTSLLPVLKAAIGIP